MRLIFINRFFFPDQSATSQLLSDLCFFLADRGFHVHVVTSRQFYENSEAKLPAEEENHGIRIHRLWSSRFGRNPLFFRVFDYLTFYLTAAWFLQKFVSCNDVLIAKTDPPLISMVAWMVGKLKGARTVNWLQDLFPEVATGLSGGWLKLIDGFLKGLRNVSLRDAVLNIAIGSRMARNLIKIGIPASKVRTVHNWADGKAIVPCVREENRLRREWGLDSRFVVGYSGNMGRAHEFETILGAINGLENRPDIAFLFIGAGVHRDWLVSELKGRIPSNVVFQPLQPRDQLRFSLSVPDVHLVTLQPVMEGLIVPSKFYGVAAAGRPTIFVGAPDGEIADILRSANCGMAIGKGDVTGLVGAIMELKQNSSLAATFGYNARQVFERCYDKTVAMYSLKQLLMEVTTSGYPSERPPACGRSSF
jgi:glycosyltransferase involved in cell wall biosynthesis